MACLFAGVYKWPVLIKWGFEFLLRQVSVAMEILVPACHCYPVQPKKQIKLSGWTRTSSLEILSFALLLQTSDDDEIMCT